MNRLQQKLFINQQNYLDFNFELQLNAYAESLLFFPKQISASQHRYQHLVIYKCKSWEVHKY